MKIAYKWVRPSNPAEALQDEMLRKAGFTDLSASQRDVYRDAPSKVRRKPDEDPLPALRSAIMALHRGDVLCVAFPQCFGYSTEDAYRRLELIARYEGALYIASTDVTIKTVPEMADVLGLMAEREAPFKKQRTEAARTERAKKQRAQLLAAIRKVKPAWNDPDKTIIDVQRETGESRSNLHRWQKMGLLPPKPRARRYLP